MIRWLDNRPSYYLTAVGFVVLLSVSLAARLPGLGDNGFYGDEETTALVSKSVASGEGFRMPSGMSYYRAAPYTLLNAISVNVLGSDSEYAYRLPAAVLGFLSPLLLFLAARSVVPVSVAFSAAAFLAFSEWHIITSREARMYAPFMLCFLLTGIMIWHWAERLEAKRLMVIVGAIALTLSIHALGIFLLIFPLVWACIRRQSAEVNWRLAILSVLIVVAYFAVNKFFVFTAFDEFRQSAPRELIDLSIIERLATDGQVAQAIFDLVPWLFGALLGLWTGMGLVCNSSADRDLLNTGAILLASAVFGAALVASEFYGAFLAGISVLLLYKGSLRHAMRASGFRLAAIFLVSVGFLIATDGFPSSAEEIKNHLLFPYPYFAYFWEYSPGLFALFWLGTGILACQEPNRTTVGVTASALVTIGILAGIGIAMKWGGIRFLIGAYPFMLLVAGYAVYWLGYRAAAFGKILGPAVAIIFGLSLLSGLFGGHGISASLRAQQLTYGETSSPLTLGFPVYPDHQGTGVFVRNHAADSDVIIAEDVLQQYWYIGRISYWLRDPVSNARFTYEDDTGIRRDIYVNSRLLELPNVRAICKPNVTNVWIITSGETYNRPELYLSRDQRAWLERLRESTTPEFVGRDGLSAVYKIECSLGTVSDD